MTLISNDTLSKMEMWIINDFFHNVRQNICPINSKNVWSHHLEVSL